MDLDELAGQAAARNGRDYVIPDDVRCMFAYAIGKQLIPTEIWNIIDRVPMT